MGVFRIAGVLMHRVSGLIVSALVAVCFAVQLTPAASQSDRTNRIDIDYVEPANEDLRAAYLDLKNRAVLEQLKVFLSPLELPRRLLIKADQCDGAIAREYEPGGPVTICYEYVRRIQQVVPEGPGFLLGPGALTGENKGALRREDLIVAPIVMQSLHQTALALFDILDVPVWGNADEAAHRLAGYLMTQFGEQIAWRMLMSSAWYLAQTTMTGAGMDFYYVRDPHARRFYNFLCLAYTSDPKTFDFLKRNLDIPSGRIDRCQQDFNQVQQAFDATILPHVDQILMQEVRARPWLTKSQPQ